MTSPITFNLGGVATDLPTLEAGLIALSIADPTSETVQGLLTFITTTEANPLHNPRALQQEILRLARTDPTILSVFMRTLSLQSGWKPQ
ncbi:MAG: hypothetical protein HY877_04285, partial [Deltaproteobacteria bacterium]|nr:hypothetical protein [Deltaproteobacteria bacterium]